MAGVNDSSGRTQRVNVPLNEDIPIEVDVFSDRVARKNEVWRFQKLAA